jgi:3-mercaptopyruvate sulfurtransferase SseA
MLIAAGHPEHRVAVLAGGIRAWHQAGYPIVRWDDAPSPEPDA